MSEIQHSARAHAALSASSSHRWMMCPPSVKLSGQFADKPSPYAEEGTFLHELCELKLHRYLGDMTPEVLEAQYAAHRDSDFYSDEAESVTDEYAAFCIETIESVRASCPDPLILVEHRLDYSEYVPEGFGTGDLVIVADGVLEVVDFKGGRGVRVEAERNSQLMLYGLGALLEFDPLYDIRNVRMTIVQPRLNNISTYETTTDELIRWAEKEVRPKALLAYEGKGEFCAGEWCRFCRARYTCRKRSEYHMRLAERDFKAPDLLTDEEILDILPVAESLNNWVADLIAYATQQAVDGKTWPGTSWWPGAACANTPARPRSSGPRPRPATPTSTRRRFWAWAIWKSAWAGRNSPRCWASTSSSPWARRSLCPRATLASRMPTRRAILTTERKKTRRSFYGNESHYRKGPRVLCPHL